MKGLSAWLSYTPVLIVLLLVITVIAGELLELGKWALGLIAFLVASLTPFCKRILQSEIVFRRVSETSRELSEGSKRSTGISISDYERITEIHLAVMDRSGKQNKDVTGVLNAIGRILPGIIQALKSWNMAKNASIAAQNGQLSIPFADEVHSDSRPSSNPN